jgi:DNA polymerase-3 subunit delta'
MLKTLEEPPSFAHLILLTSRPGEVLPTIASRCQPVRFDAPTVAEIAARLERHGVEPAVADACARLGLGDAARAQALALGDGPALRAGAEAVARGALRDEIAARPWTALLEQARSAGASAGEAIERVLDDELGYAITKDHGRMRREAAERGKRAARRAQTAALDRGLALVGLWLRDVACIADGAPELVHHSDRRARLQEDAALGSGAVRLRAAQDHVEKTRASLQFNPNEELALDALGSRLARALRAHP